jgi:hypothetical protein
MTRSLLFTAALIIAAPTAWAQTQISTPGSNGGNAVGGALVSPAPATGATSAPAGAPQISTPGSGGGNAVGGAFASPAPTTGTASASTSAPQISTPGSNGGNAVGSAAPAPSSPPSGSGQVGHSQ